MRRRGGRRRSGYRTKNKNPTRQCGEKAAISGPILTQMPALPQCQQCDHFDDQDILDFWRWRWREIPEKNISKSNIPVCRFFFTPVFRTNAPVGQTPKITRLLNASNPWMCIELSEMFFFRTEPVHAIVKSCINYTQVEEWSSIHR